MCSLWYGPLTMTRSITLKEELIKKLGLNSTNLSAIFYGRMEEKKKLRAFAEKITKTPDTVRVYTPLTEKKEREREKL